jgi:hypothetical protein
MIDATFLIDGVVIALLAITIVIAVRLERRLASLRGAHGALTTMIAELNAAAARAEAGILGLKFAAESSGGALDERIKRARALGDELAILVQSGTRLADRIDAIRLTTAAAQRASAATLRNDVVHTAARAFGTR